jgi:RNA polymerase sigma factor (sigma-70 family)
MMETGRTVLVVEDDADVREVVQFTLHSEGYRVITAGDGREALDCVAQEMPGGIVLDMKMPRMNGWEFATEFRRQYGMQTPIMVLTAAQSAAQDAQQIGADGFLDKPFDIADLISAVENLLQLRPAPDPAPAVHHAVSGEEALLQRAIAGDEQAFTELYERHSRGIFRYVYHRMGNAQDAEDVVQQVFLNAWLKIGGFRLSGHPFSSWLLTIARNLLITRYRRRRPVRSLDEPLYQATLFDDRAEADPLGMLEVQRQHDTLRAAISTLPPLQQQIILLRFVQDLRHREVAQSVNKSEAAVRVLQLRALRKLRRVLDGADAR